MLCMKYAWCFECYLFALKVTSYINMLSVTQLTLNIINCDFILCMCVFLFPTFFLSLFYSIVPITSTPASASAFVNITKSTSNTQLGSNTSHLWRSNDGGWCSFLLLSTNYLPSEPLLNSMILQFTRLKKWIGIALT